MAWKRFNKNFGFHLYVLERNKNLLTPFKNCLAKIYFKSTKIVPAGWGCAVIQILKKIYFKNTTTKHSKLSLPTTDIHEMSYRLFKYFGQIFFKGLPSFHCHLGILRPSYSKYYQILNLSSYTLKRKDLLKAFENIQTKLRITHEKILMSLACFLFWILHKRASLIEAFPLVLGRLIRRFDWVKTYDDKIPMKRKKKHEKIIPSFVPRLELERDSIFHLFGRRLCN